jgi:phage gpG-like protein
MSDAASAIDDMIARLQALEKAPEIIAREVARDLEREIRRDIAAGEGPDGAKWPPRKDGGKPLANAGAALKVSVHKTVVVAQLHGPTAMHHLGRGRGGVRRQILPDRAPAKTVKVIQATLERLAAGKLG